MFQPDAVDDKKTKKRDRWTDAAIKLLISTYKELQHLIEDKKNRTSWKKVAAIMQNYNFAYDSTQCRNKWNYLVSTYKTYKDYNSKSGNDRKDWPYLDSLDEIYAKKPEIAPLSLASNLSGFKRFVPELSETDEDESVMFGNPSSFLEPSTSTGNFSIQSFELVDFNDNNEREEISSSDKFQSQVLFMEEEQMNSIVHGNSSIQSFQLVEDDSSQQTPNLLTNKNRMTSTGNGSLSIQSFNLMGDDNDENQDILNVEQPSISSENKHIMTATVNENPNRSISAKRQEIRLKASIRQREKRRSESYQAQATKILQKFVDDKAEYYKSVHNQRELLIGVLTKRNQQRLDNIDDKKNDN